MLLFFCAYNSNYSHVLLRHILDTDGITTEQVQQHSALHYALVVFVCTPSLYSIYTATTHGQGGESLLSLALLEVWETLLDICE